MGALRLADGCRWGVLLVPLEGAPGALSGDDPRNDGTPFGREPAAVRGSPAEPSGTVGHPAAGLAVEAAAFLRNCVSGPRAAYLALYLNDHGSSLPYRADSS